MMDFKFGMATGGPIFCKIIGEYNLATLIYGETVALAKIIRDLCNSGQLLFERTTFECSEGLSINPHQDGEFDFQWKRCAYYSIDLDRENHVAPKNEL